MNNTFKNELKPEKGSKKKKQSLPIINQLMAIINVIKDEKTAKVLGILFIGFSVFLGIAMLSYLNTWQADQSQLTGSEATVNNMMGNWGAQISNFFVFKGFGLSSFLILPLLIITGFRLITKFTFANLIKPIIFTSMLMLFSSVTLGFFGSQWATNSSNKSIDFLGGILGYEIQFWLGNRIGTIGLIIFLAVVLISYLIYQFNISFNVKVSDNFKEKWNDLTNPSHEDFQEDEETPFEYSNIRQINIVETLQEREKADEEGFRLVVLENGILEQQSVSSTHQLKPNAKSDVKSNLELSIKEVPANEPEFPPHVVVKDEVANTPGSLYKYPDIELLKSHGTGRTEIDEEELNRGKELIVNTLADYNIRISRISATIGPTVTLYEIVPDKGIRINKIKGLEDDIALSLSALGIRIIAPMPGEGTIGIEVPNKNRQTVSLKETINSNNFKNNNFDLPIIMGKTISNEVYVADLAKMPHLLVGGATGKGKSVGINTIIASILYKKHPEDVKFVLIDPKRVELSLYKNIEKHFLPEFPDGQEAIITDTKMAVGVLKSLCNEMDNRLELLKNAQVRHIKEYNAKYLKGQLTPEENKMPYIILVIDELADLMMTAGKEVETPIARLAQLARAIGIHLIVATQRPSVNVITGLIKANFPARLAFGVTSKIDSRTILDAGGAEQLVGNGDMLYSNGNSIIRLQCPFIDTEEVDLLTKHISEQPYPIPFRMRILSDEEGDAQFNNEEGSELDTMFDSCARLVVESQQGSTSMLQRRLKLGFNRAGRIMDQLEKARIVGPSDGSKPRKVLYGDIDALEQYLKDIYAKLQ
ncbi:MAG: DNA translocase FtsK [Bacteroidota bacterium]|nr:DNA translocase FtsK [Bacteroidota bacterium]